MSPFEYLFNSTASNSVMGNHFVAMVQVSAIKIILAESTVGCYCCYS